MRVSMTYLQATRMSSRMKSSSFIGLGQMGYQMAFNLFSKKYEQSNDEQFVVCDAASHISKSFCLDFLSRYPNANIKIASDPAEATNWSNQIITMLPSSPQVRSVYLEFVIPALQNLHAEDSKNSFFIDSTTLDVDVAREISSMAIKSGAKMIDAPVSGGSGVIGAKNGTLSFLVGGTEESFSLARSTLLLMGQRIIHCGPSGAGLGAKLCNNLVLGVEQIVVSEAMLLGQSLGLDPAVIASVINSSTGACWASSYNNPVPSSLPDKFPPCERDYEGGFATGLMLKDMRLASDIANKQSSPLSLGEAAKELYSKALESRPELLTKDFSSVYLYLKDSK